MAWHADRQAAGRDRSSAKIEDHAGLIHAAIEKQSDITLDELRTMLAGQGVSTSIATLWRVFAHHRITRKKTAHANEQDCADIVARRWAWFEAQLNLAPEWLVFIDETWASTNMVRRYGRYQRGERLRAGVPRGHWKTTTFVADL